jgi:Tol biopolymer transport system component
VVGVSPFSDQLVCLRTKEAQIGFDLVCVDIPSSYRQSCRSQNERVVFLCHLKRPNITNVTWSPDNGHIAFIRSNPQKGTNKLMYINAITARAITDNKLLMMKGTNLYSSIGTITFSWSNYSSQPTLVVSDEMVSQVSLLELNIHSNQFVQTKINATCTTQDINWDVYGTSSPVHTPNNKIIYFKTQRLGHQTKLTKVSRKVGKKEELIATINRNYQKTSYKCSYNGEKIALLVDTTLFVVDCETNLSNTISDCVSNSAYEWSPDSKYLLYQSDAPLLTSLGGYYHWIWNIYSCHSKAQWTIGNVTNCSNIYRWLPNSRWIIYSELLRSSTERMKIWLCYFNQHLPQKCLIEDVSVNCLPLF